MRLSEPAGERFWPDLLRSITHRIVPLKLPENRGGIDYRESHAGEAEEV